MVENKTRKILLKLPTFFKKGENDNNYKFINSLSSEYSTLSNQITNLKSEIQIDTATGTYLNELAKLFNITRNGGESDEDLRIRILSYWESNSGGGTKDSITTALSLATGVEKDKIIVTDVKQFDKIKRVANAESDESWTGGTVDTTIYYEGSQSRRLTTTGAQTVSANLNGSWDLTSEDRLNDSVNGYVYIDDITKITELKITFTDSSAYTATIVGSNVVNGWNEIFKLWEDCTLSNLDFDPTSITNFAIEVTTNDTTFVCFDNLWFGVYDYSLMFDVEIEVEESTDDNALANVNVVTDSTKAAGTYCRNLTLESANNIFLVNLSSINGDDEIQ